MTTLFAFVLALAVLVVFHEYGHYVMARLFGVRVLKFSLGFGKAIYSKRFANSETEWVISSVPLGGYVKMLDEREEAVAPQDLPYAFNRKPVLQRMAIVIAGPLANFLLAILLYWGLFVHGVPGLKPVLGAVPKGTPAAVAGMQSKETILSVNGEPVPSWQDLHWLLMESVVRQDRNDANHGMVKVESTGAGGARLVHSLDISGLKAKDLDGDFLDKLGLHLYQPVVLPVIGNIAERQRGAARGPAPRRSYSERQWRAADQMDGHGGRHTCASRPNRAAGCPARHHQYAGQVGSASGR